MFRYKTAHLQMQDSCLRNVKPPPPLSLLPLHASTSTFLYILTSSSSPLFLSVFLYLPLHPRYLCTRLSFPFQVSICLSVFLILCFPSSPPSEGLPRGSTSRCRGFHLNLYLHREAFAQMILRRSKTLSPLCSLTFSGAAHLACRMFTEQSRSSHPGMIHSEPQPPFHCIQQQYHITSTTSVRGTRITNRANSTTCRQVTTMITD